MRTGIATVCLSGTLEEKMRACAIAGFDGIEIFEQDLVTSALRPERIRSMAEDLGLSLDLYQPFRDFDGVDETLLAANLRRAEAEFRLMSRLGIDTILVCSNVATATRGEDEVLAGQLRQLAELAAEHEFRIAYEALAWGKYVNDFEHAQRLVDLADHPGLGTCLDSFHILSRGLGHPPIERIDPAKIFFVLADAPPLFMASCPGRHFRVFPGEGQFDLPNSWATSSAPATAVPSPLRCSTTSSGNPTSSAPPLTRWLADLAGGTKRQMAERCRPGTRGCDPAGAGPRRRYPMELATLPQVSEPAGFNFAEVKAEDAQGL